MFSTERLIWLLAREGIIVHLYAVLHLSKGNSNSPDILWGWGERGVDSLSHRQFKRGVWKGGTDEWH